MVPITVVSAVVRRNIVPGVPSCQDVQDVVEQSLGSHRGPANVRLRWWEVFLNNRPEIAVKFPEYHNPRFYSMCSIYVGSPPCQNFQKMLEILLY